VISTAVAEEGIYVYGTAVGEIIGHRIGLGLKGWGFQGQGPIRANPVRVAGVVGTVSQGGDVTFTDARTGSLMGRARIFGGVENQPVASGDSLIIAGLDQSVWCFGTNGQERWRVRTPHKLTNQPTAINGVVYLDIPGDGMTAMDATNGTTLWKNARVHGRAVVQRAGTVLIFTKEMARRRQG
jgi:outer membrane protein assembly factor BamB